MTYNLFSDLFVSVLFSIHQQAKLQKKQAKKEEAQRLANRRDADLSIIKNVLDLQNLLNQLDDARDDFVNGTNGALVSVFCLFQLN